MSLLGLAAGLVSAVVFGLAAVAQAGRVRGFERDPERLRAFVSSSARDLGSWAVLVAYGVGFVLHAVAIQLLPLYLAQTTVAVALPVAALASALVERRLSGRRWWAVGTLSLGLVAVAAGAGGAGPVAGSGWFAVAMAASVVVLAAAVWAGRGHGGAVLGTLAGLGYAGTAVAVRGVGLPLSAVDVVAALALPALGVLAFWAYSLGMRDAVIAAVTGPMTALQTLLPAAVGVLLLGDGVRAGWWPVVVLGLVVSVVAAAVLSRDSELAASELVARG